MPSAARESRQSETTKKFVYKIKIDNLLINKYKYRLSTQRYLLQIDHFQE